MDTKTNRLKQTQESRKQNYKHTVAIAMACAPNETERKIERVGRQIQKQRAERKKERREKFREIERK